MHKVIGLFLSLGCNVSRRKIVGSQSISVSFISKKRVITRLHVVFGVVVGRIGIMEMKYDNLHLVRASAIYYQHKSHHVFFTSGKTQGFSEVKIVELSTNNKNQRSARLD